MRVPNPSLGAGDDQGGARSAVCCATDFSANSVCRCPAGSWGSTTGLALGSLRWAQTFPLSIGGEQRQPSCPRIPSLTLLHRLPFAYLSDSSRFTCFPDLLTFCPNILQEGPRERDMWLAILDNR